MQNDFLLETLIFETAEVKFTISDIFVHGYYDFNFHRFQIKASGKISWEFFLEKFQDPQAAGNGQTIPIKPGHK